MLGLGSGFLGARRRKDIFPLKEIMFEGKMFSAPNNCDGYLSLLYGDYMKLPNLDRLVYHISEIKLEK